MKNPKAIAGIVIGVLAMVFLGTTVLMNGGCPIKGGDQMTDIQKLEYRLVEAQSTIREVRLGMPLLEEALDSLCSDGPEWCKEVPDLKKDLEDTLTALEMTIATALLAINAGEVQDPAAITKALMQGSVKLFGIYIKIQAIITRHSQ
jgi:hypothetical protein